MPHVTFIHGIANKPAPEVLRRTWLRALAADGGLDLGSGHVTSSMVYWAEVMYASPEDARRAQESVEAVVEPSELPSVPMQWRDRLTGRERNFVDALAKTLNFDAVSDDDPAPPEAGMALALERIPLPGFLKRYLMQVLLRDVHHYLFNATYSPRPGVSYAIQDEIRRRVVDALKQGNDQKNGAHIVVSHSMGTVIAYDCLKRVGDCPPVDGLVTVGSPLGLDEIQDELRPEWSREDGFPHERIGIGPWVNVYDSLDPVPGVAPKLAGRYQRAFAEVVEDIREQNYGKWRHDITKYLQGSALRDRLRKMLGLR